MKKFVLLLVLLFSNFTLISCSSVDTKEQNASSLQPVIEASSDYEIDDEEFDDSDEDDEIDTMKKKMEVNDYLKQRRMGDVPTYQQIERQIKKVEIKKTVIKPVLNYDKEPHNFTADEVSGFLDDIEDTDAIEEGKDYKSKNIKHLMDNYKNILKTSSVCCVSGISEKLRTNGIRGERLLSILRNDANDYFVQDTCLIISNDDIDAVFKSKGLANIVKSTRSDCICNNSAFLRKNINNFYKIYNEDPDFYKEVLIYRYRDKQGRITEHDVNESVLNIALTLEDCPN